MDILKDFVKLGFTNVFVAKQTEPDLDLDIKEEVQSECAKYGAVKHIFVDKYWILLRTKIKSKNYNKMMKNFLLVPDNVYEV